MREWKKVRIGEITTKIGSGSTPRGGSNSYKEKGISLIRSQNILDFSFSKDGLAFIDDDQAYKLRNVIVEENDILFNITGDSVARTCKVPSEILPARVNQHVAILRADNINLNNNFLLYLMQDKKEELLILSEIGATRNAITKVMLENFEIQLPPLPEQKAIAGVLSSLDDKIDLLHQQNETLEALAETLFRQWFVEEAKEDWEEGKLGDLIDIFSGYSYKGDKIGEGQSLLLGMGCVSYKDRFLYSGMRKYNEAVNTKFLVKKGDIVIATRQQSDNFPILGAPALIPEIDQNFQVIVGTNLYKVVNNSNLNYYTLFKLLKSREYENFIKSNAKGSTVRMITKDAILSFPLLLPPYCIIKKLNIELGSINNKIEVNINQIQTLTQLRDTLLPKLMRGEVRVQL